VTRVDAQHLLIQIYAHIPPVAALERLEPGDAERRIEGTPHSIAETVAHMAFWQEWFVRRCTGIADPMPAPAARGWPVVEAGSWLAVHARFVHGLDAATALDAESDRPLAPPIEFPPLANYTVRHALVHVAQHNSHHLGQIVLLRQMMGLWPPPSGAWTW
jgi:uncharacterized damage-inducible protein DinB